MIKKERLKQAREIIEKMKRELIDCLAVSDETADVYQLEVRLYPATDLNIQEDK